MAASPRYDVAHAVIKPLLVLAALAGTAHAQGFEGEVSGAFVRPLDDSASLNDGTAVTATGWLGYAVAERFAIGPALVIDRASIPFGAEPRIGWSAFAAVRAVADVGDGIEATATLGWGASRREQPFDMPAEWTFTSQRLELGVRYRWRHVAAGMVVAYEEYFGGGSQTFNQLVAGVGVAAAVERREARGVARMRASVGAGVGYAGVGRPCSRCGDVTGLGFVIGASAAITDELDAGVEGLMLDREWFVGPAVRWQVRPRIAVRAAIGAGTWDGDDGDGGLLGATGISALIGADVALLARRSFGVAGFARAVAVRGQGLVPVALAGIAIAIGR